MDFPTDQLEELKQLFPGVAFCEEGGAPYFLLPSLQLPHGCEPSAVDTLLCPISRDGYRSRLYFAQIIKAPPALNWNSKNVMILGRTWHAYSWRTEGDHRLAQMVMIHLLGLQNK